MTQVMLDMYRVSEEERIKLIAAHVHTHGRAIFMVDGDSYDKGKADRYVRKLKESCSRIHEVERKLNDPVKRRTGDVVSKRRWRYDWYWDSWRWESGDEYESVHVDRNGGVTLLAFARRIPLCES